MDQSNKLPEWAVMTARLLVKILGAYIIMLGLGSTSFPSLGYIDVFWGLIILDITAFSSGLTK